MTSLIPSCFESLLGANIYSADYRRDRIPGLQTHPLWHLQVVLGHLPTLPILLSLASGHDTKVIVASY